MNNFGNLYVYCCHECKHYMTHKIFHSDHLMLQNVKLIMWSMSCDHHHQIIIMVAHLYVVCFLGCILVTTMWSLLYTNYINCLSLSCVSSFYLSVLLQFSFRCHYGYLCDFCNICTKAISNVHFSDNCVPFQIWHLGMNMNVPLDTSKCIHYITWHVNTIT